MNWPPDLPPFDHLPILYQAVACLGFIILPLFVGLFMTVRDSRSDRHIE